MRFMFDTDEAFSYETLRAVGYAPYGGADIGEVMATAARITPGDWESWYREWRALAERIATIADQCAADGHAASASSAYLRASNYYRTAEFFLRDDPSNDPRVADTSARAIEAFRAAPEIQAQWTRVAIPYEGIELEGYYLNSSGDQPGRTLLAHGGYDSTVEELFFTVGEAARRRGWNCLIFEGPGQGSALRLNKLPFRHDWEAVVTPVVDLAVNLRGVDPERIALLGMSMGGYLAPRAAAFEHRISACIAYDGVFNYAATLPEPQLDAKQRTAALENLFAHRTDAPSSQRWGMSNAVWTLGVATGQELLDEFSKYDLTEVVDQITCPTLVCEAENDHFFSGQPRRLYEALHCPKTFLSFTAAEGAEEHCHVGALTLFHQRMFDWLDDTLGSSRSCAMTVFPYPKLNAEQEAEYELFPINLTRMMLHTQGLTLPYWQYGLSFRNAKITPVLRERVILRVGAVADCEYQLVQHKTEALRTGTSQELLAELINPQQQEFDDPSLTALVKYVDSLVKNIGAKQDTLDVLRKYFPDNEVAEITLLAGTYVLCAAFLKSLHVPLDDGPVDWTAADTYMKEAGL